MADPRKVAAYDDIEPLVLTLEIDDSSITYDQTKTGGSAQIGLAVNFSDDGIVQLAGDGEAVAGVLILVEGDNMCSVQVGGVAKFKGGTSATLTPGTPITGDLLSSAEGYVQTAADTTGATKVARGMIIDATDTGAVYVLLD